MSKRGFENGNIVPIAPRKMSSSQGKWTPRTQDATERTYTHLMHTGAMNSRQNAIAYREAQRQAALGGIRRRIEQLKKRRDGGQVLSFDK